MRLLFLLCLASVVVVSASSDVQAQSPSAPTLDRDRADCEEWDSPRRIEACSRLLGRDELTPEQRFAVHDWRLSARIETRDYAGAIADADRMGQLQPTSVLAMAGRCFTRALAGLELDVADRFCEAAIARSDALSLYAARGLLRLKQNRNQEAWSDFDRVVVGDSGTSEQPLYGRGIAALRLGRIAEGRNDIAAAVIINTGVAALFENWGVRPPAADGSPVAPAPASRPAAPPAVDAVLWLRQPVPEYPDRALRLEVEGDVYLTCGLWPSGHLRGCEVVREPLPQGDPERGYGFGRAAIRAAEDMGRLDMTAFETPPERITFMIAFRLD